MPVAASAPAGVLTVPVAGGPSAHLVAAGLAGLAVLLAWPGGWRPVGPEVRRTRVLLPTAIVGVLAVLALPAGVLVPAAVAGGAAGGLLALRRRRAAVAAARERADRVQEVCEVMAGDLAAGLPPGGALAAAAAVWPELGEVAATQRLGGAVPEALDHLARRPGAGDLRLVAAAWQVSHRSGAGLADALAGVAEALRDRQSLRRLVRSELASARATARLMVALPVLTLLMGSGIGGDPVGFLLAGPPGWACLAAGLALALAGLWWIEAIAGGIESRAA